MTVLGPVLTTNSSPLQNQPILPLHYNNVSTDHEILLIFKDFRRTNQIVLPCQVTSSYG